jgi:hypothetical protein
MASFLSKIFGGKQEPQPSATVEYQGCTIQPIAEADGGQWRISGKISRQIGSETFERRFVRADLLASKDEAEAASIRKAQQIIDERGDLLFADSTPERV